jgi:NitT/TauT family transport system substrate-binding protein
MKTAICALGVLLVLGMAPTEAIAAEPIPFSLGEASPANTYLAIWMAEEAGLYQAQELELHVVPMNGGSQTAPELEAGNIQLMHIGMSSVVRANMMGSDLRVIGSLSNVIRHTMFLAPGVRNAEDLRGRAVGISSAGSESDSTTTLALERIGLTRDDVRIREIGRDRLDQVRRGMVSATMLGEPSRSEALAIELNPIVDLYADRIAWLFSGLTVDRAYLNVNRDLVLRFMRATIEGNYIAITNEVAAKNVLARRLDLNEAGIVDASYDNFKLETPINAEIDPAGAQNIVDALASMGASDDISDYIDLSIGEELRAEGFYAAMKEKYGLN